MFSITLSFSAAAMWLKRAASFAASLSFIACSNHSVTRDQAIATAYAYTQVKWRPETRHIKHGDDKNGILVHTPDLNASRSGALLELCPGSLGSTARPTAHGFATASSSERPLERSLEEGLAVRLGLSSVRTRNERGLRPARGPSRQVPGYGPGGTSRRLQAQP